jgi:hypothetical protein
VDDFALACIDNDTAHGIMTLIVERIHLPSKAVIPIACQGLITHNSMINNVSRFFRATILQLRQFLDV